MQIIVFVAQSIYSNNRNTVNGVSMFCTYLITIKKMHYMLNKLWVHYTLFPIEDYKVMTNEMQSVLQKACNDFFLQLCILWCIVTSVWCMKCVLGSSRLSVFRNSRAYSIKMDLQNTKTIFSSRHGIWNIFTTTVYCSKELGQSIMCVESN